jgi:hypothetical protein
MSGMRWIHVALVFSCLGFAPRAGLAVVVAPGTVHPLSGTTSAANPNLAGVVQSDPLVPFEIVDDAGAVLVRGNLQDRVVRSNATGTLVFAPRLRDLEAPSGPAEVIVLRVTGHDGVSTDVEYRTDGLGDIGPGSVSRSAGAGDVLTFRYAPASIAPPDESLFISIFTDAEHFARSGSTTIVARAENGKLSSVTIPFTNAPDPDSDRDRVRDSLDLCPATPDPEQVDTDGNGIGDACECSDQTGDGHVNALDLIAINLAIYNPKLATPLCDGNADDLCDISDIVAANLKIFGWPSYCSRYPKP